MTCPDCKGTGIGKTLPPEIARWCERKCGDSHYVCETCGGHKVVPNKSRLALYP